MSIYKYDIMKYIYENGYNNQRIISESTNYSLGKVNEAIGELVKEGYLNDRYIPTDKFKVELANKKPKNAIILAAGFGLRMVPINTEIPKGLLEVHGDILIERLIKQLHEVGIYDISIVVGFLKEKYEYLIDKYKVSLIYNPDYVLKNNIHSLKLVVDKISNSYIIPCDIWSKNNPFSSHELYSWYSVSNVKNNSSTVRVNRKRKLVPVGGGKKGNKMIGISYLLEEQAKTLRDNILLLCSDENFNNAFWEEALFHNKNRISLYARIYPSDEVFEIDTYEQLRELDDTSSNLDSSILSLIARVMNVDIKDICNISILKKGMTNRSFMFSVGDKQYIMRIPGEGTDKLINRKNEYIAYEAIKGKNISDKVIYMSPESGYKITEYIEDARVCDPFNKEDVKLCMKKLREFHSIRLKVPHTFDIFAQIDFYESLWEGRPSIFRDYLETKKKVMELRPIIESLPKEWILTHIDANADNFLFSGSEIKLIDWEYASMQDPHLDIAMFAIYSMYGREDADALIDSYFTEGCSDEIKMKIYCYIAVCGLLWSNWCEYKRLCGVELGEYSLWQYRYAKEYYSIVMDEFVNKRSV